MTCARRAAESAGEPDRIAGDRRSVEAEAEDEDEAAITAAETATRGVLDDSSSSSSSVITLRADVDAAALAVMLAVDEPDSVGE